MAARWFDHNQSATARLHKSQRVSLPERILPAEPSPSPQAHVFRESRAAPVAPAPFADARLRIPRAPSAFGHMRPAQGLRSPTIAKLVSQKTVIHTQA